MFEICKRLGGISSPRDEWLKSARGDFKVPTAVVKVLPKGFKVISAEKHGTSSWTKTGRLEVYVKHGERKRYFIKCVTGESARAMAEGEYLSAKAINAALQSFCPEPAGWGVYFNGGVKHYFYLGQYLDMDLSAELDPVQFAAMIAALHTRSASPYGKFGFHVPTAIGKMQRTVTWESSWASAFTNLLKDVHENDKQTNGTWFELDDALQQLYDVVIPRLLGVLQSDGNNIAPVLVHGDLWENNIGIDKATGRIVVFDPGCIYAHNEFEFGTWRCSWTFQFNKPEYLREYQKLVEPSEPKEEWDDRNRLYSIHPYLVDSAGHAGSGSRKLAYNDVLYLCEKYGFPNLLEKYNPAKDVFLTKEHRPFVISQLE